MLNFKDYLKLFFLFLDLFSIMVGTLPLALMLIDTFYKTKFFQKCQNAIFIYLVPLELVKLMTVFVFICLCLTVSCAVCCVLLHIGVLDCVLSACLVVYELCESVSLCVCSCLRGCVTFCVWLLEWICIDCGSGCALIKYF